MTIPDHLLIEGNHVPGDGPKLSVIDPAKGEPHIWLHSASTEQLRQAPGRRGGPNPGGETSASQTGAKPSRRWPMASGPKVSG